MTEDEMVGWHYRLDGHEFEQAPGIYLIHIPLGVIKNKTHAPWKESYDQPRQHIKKQTLLCQQRSL